MKGKDPVLYKLFNYIYGRMYLNKESLAKLLKPVDIECTFIVGTYSHLQIKDNKFTLYIPTIDNCTILHFILKGYLIKKYLNTNQIELISLHNFKFASDVETQIKKDLFPDLIEYSLEDILNNILNTVDFYLDNSIRDVWSKIRISEAKLETLEKNFYIFNTLIKYYVNPKLLFRQMY